MEPEDYFGVGRGAIRIDNAAGGGVFCLLWGEPGVRLVLGLVFGFAFWALFLGFCCGVLFFGFAFGFCCGVNLAFAWFWGWFLFFSAVLARGGCRFLANIHISAGRSAQAGFIGAIGGWTDGPGSQNRDPGGPGGR